MISCVSNSTKPNMASRPTQSRPSNKSAEPRNTLASDSQNSVEMVDMSMPAME